MTDQAIQELSVEHMIGNVKMTEDFDKKVGRKQVREERQEYKQAWNGHFRRLGVEKLLAVFFKLNLIFERSFRCTANKQEVHLCSHISSVLHRHSLPHCPLPTPPWYISYK
jgi:hypothetical protein